MWESSLKGSEFCFLKGNDSVGSFRPCIDHVILPGIFAVYIVLWYLVDIEIYKARFWKQIGKSVGRAFKKLSTIVQFFCSCFASHKQIPQPPSDWEVNEDTNVNMVEKNESVGANFINPKCGNCFYCRNNIDCPMKVWHELKKTKLWYRPYQLLASSVGILATIYNIFIVALPENAFPNTDNNDTKLKKLISIAPEWSLMVHLAMQTVISLIVVELIRKQMNRVPNNTMTHRVALFFEIHLCCYSSFLVIALLPSIVSIINGWLDLHNQDDIPISIFWTVLIVLVWLLLSISVIGMIIICVKAVKRHRSIYPYTADSLKSKKTVSSIELINTAVESDSWIYPEVEKPDGCGCGCCSSTGTFRIDRNPPEYKASLFSRLTFSWISPLVALGYSRPLDIEDLTKIPDAIETEKLERRFTYLWQNEVARKGSNASLMKVSFKFCKVSLIKSGICKLIYDTLSFGGPLILNLLITFLSHCGALYDESRIDERQYIGSLFLKGIGIVLLLLLDNALMTLFLHQYFHHQFKAGMATRAAIVGFVYSKALKISSGMTKGQSDGKSEASSYSTMDGEIGVNAGSEDTQKKEKTKEKVEKKQVFKEATTTGEIVNLMAVDAQRMQELMPYVHLLWSSPFQIIVSLVLLWRQLGASMIAGVGVMAISIPLTTILGKRIKDRQRSLMILRDERIKITNEVFAGMKIIKVYAWEDSFRKKVADVREHELKGLWKFSLLTMSQRILWTAVPVLVSLVSFLTYVAVGYELTAAKAFTSISLFNLLRFPLNVFPMMISLLTESLVALTRIRNFVLRSEVAELPDPPAVVMNKPSELTVVAQNLSLRWPNGAPAIDKVTFSCSPGTVTAIIGKTGAGKTSLLAAIIGDLIPEPRDFCSENPSSLLVKGRLAYVAQIAWITNATLRENILFGRPFNAQWYARVIRACALKPDIDILPAGDMTEIGEKGVNLSGGQKQRVSLARAVYQCGAFPSSSPLELPADIYILDDCLSAVDSHVGQHIFEKCILGLLRETKRTVIFCTHKVDILPRVDHIIFMEREPLSGEQKEISVGRIAASGSHSELLSNSAYVYFTEEARSQELEEAKQRVEEKDEQREESIVPSEMSPEGVALSESKSFIEGEAVEGRGQAQIPTDNHRTSISEALRIRKVSSTLDELMSQLATRKHPNIKVKGGLTDKESLEQGAVGADVYRAYFQGVGGPGVLCLILLSLALSQGSQVASNYWISYWSDHRDTIEGLPTGISVYSALAVLQILLYTITAFSVILASQRASKAPMAFFDATPLGRIINRFSKDLYTIDQTLPQTMNMYITNLFSVIATFAVIIVATPWFAVICIPLLTIYGYIQQYYIPSSRQLQRVDSVLRSPIFAHFSETLDGVPTIRAYRAQRRFKEMNTEKIDYQQRAYYLLIASNRWLAVRLETVGTLVIMFSSLLAVFGGLRGSISPGLGGLAISYALNITQALNWMVRMTSDRESNIVSVERIQEYSEKIPEEAPAIIEGHRPPKSWPEKGAIDFDGYQLRYRPKLQLVLKGLKLSIKPEEKVGIVGRTGAGKSSVFIGLLRLVEPAGGLIVVDSVDIGKIGLFDLRSRFSIIPQDPVLFTGTLRFNLDPFETNTDAELWQALERSHLKSFVESEFMGGLNGLIEEGGKNLSMGQKQLVCLARALLRRSKILLLDEATSAVDPLTDRLIQQTIRDEFKDCTILTIAHRLGTVMDYDKILVLDSGIAVEFGAPQELIMKSKGIFRALCINSGIVTNNDKKNQ